MINTAETKYTYSTEQSRQEAREQIRTVEAYTAIVRSISAEARKKLHAIEKFVGIETAMDITLIMECMREEEEAIARQEEEAKYILINGIKTDISYQLQAQFN